MKNTLKRLTKACRDTLTFAKRSLLKIYHNPEKLFDVTQEALKEIVFDIDISSRGMEKTAKESLRRINFDIDIWTEPLERAVKESNLRNGLERYLETL